MPGGCSFSPENHLEDFGTDRYEHRNNKEVLMYWAENALKPRPTNHAAAAFVITQELFLPENTNFNWGDCKSDEAGIKA